VERLAGVRVVFLRTDGSTAEDGQGRPVLEYKVLWEDDSPWSWEPAGNLAPDLLRDYEESWFTAAKKGDRNAIMDMLEGGREVLVQTRDKDGRAALHYSAGVGSAEAVSLLLANGADPDGPDKDGYTPLHLAAGYMNLPIVELLLQAGADPEVEDSAGRSPSALVENLKANLPGGPMNYQRRAALDAVETVMLKNLYEEALPRRILDTRRVDLRSEYLVEWEDGPEPEWIKAEHVAEDVLEDFQRDLEYAYAEALVDDRVVEGKREFLVQWRDEEEDSWEVEEHVTPDLVKAYLEPLGRVAEVGGVGGGGGGGGGGGKAAFGAGVEAAAGEDAAEEDAAEEGGGAQAGSGEGGGGAGGGTPAALQAAAGPGEGN